MKSEPDMELSCGLPPGPEFADLAVLAEQVGYTRVWIFDSAPLWEDPFAHLALAAVRTTRIGLATAVLIPSQRSVMTMASGIATIARLSGGRFRACFGTGYTARLAMAQRPIPLRALVDYVGTLRHLLAGETAIVDGTPARMLHAKRSDRAAPDRGALVAQRVRSPRQRAGGRCGGRDHRATAPDAAHGNDGVRHRARTR